MYNLLKVGGTLVFAERWWDHLEAPGDVLPLMDLDVGSVPSHLEVGTPLWAA